MCSGEGEVSKWLVLKENCSTCNGKGTITKCPDMFKHVWKDLHSPHQEIRRRTIIKPSIQDSILKTPRAKAENTLQDLIRKGQILPPWHPNWPNPWDPDHPNNPQVIQRRFQKYSQHPRSGPKA
ncbi:hypothetical protein KAI12_03775 [Candidatus Bathyarchaeota archaeon]|nr:hypothetical protein [Candidatus Bathyarchaeota archaeon]